MIYFNINCNDGNTDYGTVEIEISESDFDSMSSEEVCELISNNLLEDMSGLKLTISGE
jgi:hypothetical protein